MLFLLRILLASVFAKALYVCVLSSEYIGWLQSNSHGYIIMMGWGWGEQVIDFGGHDQMLVWPLSHGFRPNLSFYFDWLYYWDGKKTWLVFDTSLGWGKQVIDFDDHDPIFKVTLVMFDQMLSYLMNSEQTWLIV